ncbi:MAG: hypothetical protein S4CHLAM123_03870 [Chlamydiales bacterium]|nr:hypothetical protein [Chlamydiales bacterium]
MNQVTFINNDQKQTIEDLHEKFNHQKNINGLTTAAAAFLLTGALIVIACGCLCLTLPGVNVLNAVIFPAVLPGCCAIAATIPLILISLKAAKHKKNLREQLVEQIITLLDEYEVPRFATKKDQSKFIIKNFLKKGWTKEYRNTLITDIKERLKDPEAERGKERNPDQEIISEALDEAMNKINSRKNNRK